MESGFIYNVSQIFIVRATFVCDATAFAFISVTKNYRKEERKPLAKWTTDM